MCVCVKIVMHLILMFKQKQLIIIIPTCKEQIFSVWKKYQKQNKNPPTEISLNLSSSSAKLLAPIYQNISHVSSQLNESYFKVF